MSTAHITAPRAAASAPRVRNPHPSVPTQRTAAGATSATGPRRRNPVSTAVRNVGIALDTAARVVFLGRDGVGL
ncbi:hypothetical protein AB0D08_26240 [Kitasatospora sp. NPDC048540]|uniref:hypothetical protein n=1 Tax=unclassified Kitasatospora TaxID=2633591 RepID=UPI000539D846|nr:hypothetical protein [Kitasatospora sp. MBT63]